eukprot:TRINITY_DN2723_c2_g1_i1.p1 TRINITY_DN2723_c2_g1~~TRINITY_DN2723_c2_g1_i1.p1  ORF type:complete len:200 (+),score=92.65 TRINITY_DN2723_c2_g1_i1:73-600(+)
MADRRASLANSSFRKNEEVQLKQQISEAFKLFDADGSGAIDLDEMKLAMKGLGFENVPTDEIEAMLKAIDKDGNQTIEEAEFVEMMTAKIASRDSPEEISRAFELFCKHGGSSSVSADTMRKVAKLLGENISDSVFDEFIQVAKADCREAETISDDDGSLNMGEWHHVMNKCKGK